MIREIFRHRKRKGEDMQHRTIYCVYFTGRFSRSHILVLRLLLNDPGTRENDKIKKKEKKCSKEFEARGTLESGVRGSATLRERESRKPGLDATTTVGWLVYATCFSPFSRRDRRGVLSCMADIDMCVPPCSNPFFLLLSQYFLSHYLSLSLSLSSSLLEFQ